MDKQATKLPTEAHVKRIRKLLWSGIEHGRAAVMVGAGFSRNARRNSSSTKPMPNWTDLARHMYATIYSVSKDDERALRASPLVVAQEFENVFGRLALDDLLLDIIPDDDYSPGQLHQLLLDLPWADVFTTNYDTLLERTLTGDLRQKYNAVHRIEDLAGKTQPRIVKLHGSFPSHRPFIITEEDYRTYPKEFAPFVNTVQQSLMENVLCLLGFSGDDPNFKQWLGWVRDNLGRWAPKVHLIGVFDYSPQRIVSLEKSGVIAVDLAPLFPSSKFPNQSVRHYSAMEWFLRSLYRPVPSVLSNWPDVVSSLYSSIIAHSPERYPPLVGADYSEPLQRFISQRSQPPSGPMQQARFWEALRKLYPGWVVLPKSNTTQLLVGLSKTLPGLLDDIPGLNPPDRIVALHEVLWIQERLLIQLDSEHAEMVENALQNVNPRPDLLHQMPGAISPSPEGNALLDWNELDEKWFSLGLSLLRKFREDYEGARFEHWYSILSKATSEDPGRCSRLSIELALYHLSSLRERELRKALNEWAPTPEVPFNEVRRAAILAEIGDYQEAHSLVARALESLRYDDIDAGDNFEQLSQEGAALWLAHILGFQLRIDETHDSLSVESEERSRKRESDNRRWEKIGRLGCDPWERAERMGEELPRGVSTAVETKKLFDIDQYRTTFRHRTGDRESDALQFLRAVEDSAIPYRCGMNAQYGKSIAAAAVIVGGRCPLKALSTLARSGQRESIEDVFNKRRIRSWPSETIERLFELAASAMEQALELADEREASRPSRLEGTMAYRVATACGQILSRLLIRIDGDQRRKVLDLSCRAFRSPLFRISIGAHEHLHDMFRRLLSQVDDEDIDAYLSLLFELPILDSERGFDVSFYGRWPEPTRYLGLSSAQKAQTKFSPEPQMVERLVRLVGEGSEISRPIAASRLDALFALGLLDEETALRFGEAIWSRINEHNGLPADLDYNLHAYLRLPSPPDVDVPGVLHLFLLNCDLPPATGLIVLPEGAPIERERKTESLGPFHDLVSQVRNISKYPGRTDPEHTYIEWTPMEALEHFSRVYSWVDQNVPDLRELASFVVNEHRIRELLSDLAELIGFVLLPEIEVTKPAVVAKVKKYLEYCNEFGCPALELLPGLMIHAPETADSTLQRLYSGLLSRDRWIASSAHRAVWRWIVLSKERDLRQCPSKLVSTVVGMVTNRCTRNFCYSMELINSILKHYPEVLTKDEIDNLIEALNSLLGEFCLLERTKEGDESCMASSGIPMDSIEEHKRECVIMAHRLYSAAEMLTAEQTAILEAWRLEAAKDDEKEIRDAWHTTPAKK